MGTGELTGADDSAAVSSVSIDFDYIRYDGISDNTKADNQYTCNNKRCV